MKDSSRMLQELLPRWNRFVGRGFKCSLPEGMSPPMHLLLTFLCDGPLSMSYIAKRLQITKQQMTVMADKVIKLGMVRRINDPKDRRVVLLEATEKGRALLAESQAKSAEYFSSMFETMGEENEQRFVHAMSELNAVFAGMENREKANKRKETD